METIEQHVAKYIFKKCKSYGTLEAWLDEFYLWPKNSKKRLNLYKQFNKQPWIKTTIEQVDDKCYQKTKLIKQTVSSALNSENDIDKILKLTEFFIEDWGGVTRKVKKELRGKDSHHYYNDMVQSRLGMLHKNDQFYSSLNKNDSKKRINRYKLVSSNSMKNGAVSSWSKFLTIAYPEWAYIYDARVAYALNALIYLNKITSARLWPMPSGLNSRIGLIDIETLVIVTQFKDRGLHNIYNALAGEDKFVYKLRKQLYLPEDQTYLAYLSLLENVSNLLSSDKYRLNASESEIEAFLFIIADSDLFDDVILASH